MSLTVHHLPASPHSLTIEQLSKILDTDPKDGLSTREAHNRLHTFGSNLLPEPPKIPLWKKFLAQFNDFLIFILVAGTIFAILAGDWIDAVVILIVVLGNTTLAFLQEYKAELDLRALKHLSIPTCQVRRGGNLETVDTSELVPGDILIINTGDQIAADGRLITSVKLEVDESSLTGESLPVKKHTHTQPAHLPLNKRSNFCFQNSQVRFGHGEMIVTATGVNTEIGFIATTLINTPISPTPLELQLHTLGRRLGITALSLCLIIFLLNWLHRQSPLIGSLLDSISLAIAVVPEGLPAVITICLSIGVQTMRRHNALVRHLPAIETLGSVDYIATDKTGTITTGNMIVSSAFYDIKTYSLEELPKNLTFRSLLQVAVSCNNATVDSGSPTEQALINFATIYQAKPLNRLDENPFDSTRKLMSTIHVKGNKYLSLVKGSPDHILARSTHFLYHGNIKILTPVYRRIFENQVKEYSDHGFRVLALAENTLQKLPHSLHIAESNLTFIGLLALKDPIRDSAVKAIKAIKKAGITPIMITGDNPHTATNIALEAGILDKNYTSNQIISGADLKSFDCLELTKACDNVRVYAGIEPLDKLKIVSALKAKGYIVAMTGDGVNDAPAIKAANIGLAMGIRGTEVTKSVADIILTDDNYHTIVTAIAQGRVIFRNIRLFTTYLLSCNFSELLIAMSAIILDLPLPFTARLLLYLNIVTDFLPSLALAYESVKNTTMSHGPTKSNKVLDTKSWIHLITQAVVTTIVVITVYSSLHTRVPELAITSVFTLLAFAEIFRAFTSRSQIYSIFFIGFFKNMVTNIGVLISLALTLAVVYLPAFNHIFATKPLPVNLLVSLALFALIMPITEELTKFLIRLRSPSPIRARPRPDRGRGSGAAPFDGR